MHISEIPSDQKTAGYLAKVIDRDKDEYLLAIAEAADVLVAEGKPCAKYLTQWSSGTTLWTDYFTGQTLVVTRGGELSN